MISIIMPLYNAQRFLEEAIDSVLAQTYRDLELICIDDASTDETTAIVENRMKTDSRIRLYRNGERLGAAGSRNRGIELAKGDYITFLDGDDVFDEEMLNEAYTCAESHQLDIVVYEMIHVRSENIHQKRALKRDDGFRERFCVRPFTVRELRGTDICAITHNPGNKLYRMKLIRDHHIRFQVLQCCNDVYFVETALCMAERILFTDSDRVMGYARDHDSRDRISHYRDPMCGYHAYMHLLETLVEQNLLKECGIYFYSRCYETFCGIAGNKDGNILYEYLSKEGVSELYEKGGALLKEVTADLPYRLEWFCEKPFGSEWFRYKALRFLKLWNSESRLWDFWSSYGKIAVWGAGKYGELLIRCAQEKGYGIECVIDSNPEKEGKQLLGIPVCTPEHAREKQPDLIIVAVKGRFHEMKDQFADTVLVDVEQYL